MLILPDVCVNTCTTLFGKLLMANTSEANSLEVQLLRLLGISDKLRIESRQLPTVLIRSSAGSHGSDTNQDGGRAGPQSQENAFDVLQMKTESELVVDDVDIIWSEVKKGRVNHTDTIKAHYEDEDDNKAENELEEELKSFDDTLLVQLTTRENLSSNFSQFKEHSEQFKEEDGPQKIRHCRKCAMYFPSLEEFLTHKKENPDHFQPKKRREYKCRFCDLDFTKQPFDVYKDHIRGHRNEDGEYPCLHGTCGKTFPTWGHMNDHMYVHGLWDRPHKCSFCDYSTTTKANVAKHEMAMHIDPNRRDFVCNQCNKAFKTSSNMYEHMRSHDPKNKFICEICNKVFKSTPGFTQHMRLHTGELFECSVCKEKFQSRNSMQRHEKEVHGVFPNPDGSKSYRCRSCDVEFDNEADYRTHQKTAHRSSAAIICPVCQKIFWNKPSLKQHIKRTHIATPQPTHLSPRKSLLKTGEQMEKSNLHPVPIRIVYETPKRKPGLSLLKSTTPVETDSRRSHPRKLKSRKSLKSHVCKICSNKFLHGYQVLAHQAIKHYGHFRCIFSGCPSSQEFGSVKRLCRHLRRHTKEKLWSCRCGKCFLFRHNYVCHVSSYPCPAEQCGQGFCEYHQLDQHWSSHDPKNNINSWFCALCNICFDSKAGKEAHVGSQHINKWTCKCCNEKKKSRKDLKIHMAYCKLNRGGSGNEILKYDHLDGFQCEVCQKKFLSIDFLNRHLAVVHDCDPSKKNSSLFSDLNFDSKKEKRDCIVCDKSFCSKQSLERHIIAHHNKAAMEFCDICNKLVLDLKAHTKRTHSEISYPCSFCEKSFQYKTSLKKHINHSHGQLQAGICSFCDKPVEDLSRHFREVHNYQTEGAPQEEQTYHMEGTNRNDVVVDEAGIVYQVRDGDDQSISLYQVGAPDDEVREVILQPQEVVFQQEVGQDEVVFQQEVGQNEVIFQQEVGQDEVVFQVGDVEEDVKMFRSCGQEEVVFEVETTNNETDMIIYNIDT